MNDILNNLIEIRFYEEKAVAIAKVDVCFAMDKINDVQYAALTLLVNEKYPVLETPAE